MEHNTLFKLVYTFILGVVIALFFGIGVAAFYEHPAQPTYPSELSSALKLDGTSQLSNEEQQKLQQKFQYEQEQYDKAYKTYSRNISIILLVLALVAVVAAFVLTGRLGFLTDGILLGGLLTMLYSIARGLSADDNKFLFVIVAIATAVVLFLGYRRFILPLSKAAKK